MININLGPFMEAVWQCAMQMMNNAEYVRRELPALKLTDELHTLISSLCDEWTSTKFDVFTEMYDLRDGITTNAFNAPEILVRCVRVETRLNEPIGKADGVIKRLETAKEGNECADAGLAWMLVAESATNVLNANAEVSASMPTNWPEASNPHD
jgi:hypothetical protein